MKVTSGSVCQQKKTPTGSVLSTHAAKTEGSALGPMPAQDNEGKSFFAGITLPGCISHTSRYCTWFGNHSYCYNGVES